MPRLFLSPSEYQATPAGVGTAIYTAQLPDGQLDAMCFAASTRADTFTHRFLQYPSPTTLSAQASAGTTHLSLDSLLSIPEQQGIAEVLAVLEPGTSNTETIAVIPGTASITRLSAGDPYPGTVSLASATQYTHASGATVNFLYREIRKLGRSPDGQRAWRVWLSSPPIVGTPSLIEIDVTGSGVWYPVSTIAYNIDPVKGCLYLPFAGLVGTQGALVRVTYAGGYTDIPYDIKKAVSYFVTDDLHFMVNPWMAVQQQIGKTSAYYVPRAEKHKTGMTTQAENQLVPYIRPR